MRKIRKNMSLFLMCCIILQISFCPVNATANMEKLSEDNIISEMRGIWVASVYNLDYPTIQTTDIEILKKEAIEILDDAKDLGMTAVFLQVRPTADALYDSNIFPWSRFLTGENGLAPKNNFDPLTFWCDETHKRGLELHAWINPYRVTKNGDEEYQNISSDSPAKKYSEYIVRYSDGNYYFDPGIPEVRKLVIDGIVEIVNNYEIDGIHMDDYFYPGTNFDDANTFSKYKNGFTNIDDWRRNNVNLLIKEISDKINQIDSTIEFGISPAGIWANKKNNELGSETSGTESYYQHYADTRKWAQEEWIDYIAPQIYWEIGHKSADYEKLVNWWSEILKDSKTDLYIGIADYKTIDVKNNSVWYKGKEIEKQLKLNDNFENIKGEIHYRYSSLIGDKDLYNKVKEYYSKQDIKVYVHGKKVNFDQEPIIKDGRTLVPLRKIFEALNASVDWNAADNSVKVTKGNRNIEFIIGNKKMKVGEKEIILDVEAQLINGRTLVPLRAISEAMELTVDWNGTTKIVNVY